MLPSNEKANASAVAVVHKLMQVMKIVVYVHINTHLKVTSPCIIRECLARPHLQEATPVVQSYTARHLESLEAVIPSASKSTPKNTNSRNIVLLYIKGNVYH